MNNQPELIIDSSGHKIWIWKLNGLYHREDGPAYVWENGDKEWYLNGRLHREDGPACEYISGTKYWCLDGKLHRTDGPACEYKDGYKDWYLNDCFFSSKEEWFQALTPEQQYNYLWNLDEK